MKGSAYGYGSQETFRYVSDNDTDQEDDGVEPVVSEDEGDDEEADSEEHGHAGDDVDKVTNLTSNWGLSHLKSRSQVSDTSHHGAVTTVHNNTTAGTWKQENRW